MVEFKVTFEVGGLVPFKELLPINIGKDAILTSQQEKVKLSITLDADSGELAFERAAEMARAKLSLLQVSAMTISTYFDIYPIEDQFEVVRTSDGQRVKLLKPRTISLTVSTLNKELLVREIGRLDALRLTDEDRIIIHYFSNAMEDKKDVYRFLNCIIVIEAMVSDSDETTEKTSRRLAVLLASRYPDLQKTYRDFKGLYRLRSQILHGGKIPNLLQADVAKISDYARAATRNFLLLRKDSSKKTIKEKLDNFFDPTVIAEIKQKTTLD
jgi:hypothetical protein